MDKMRLNIIFPIVKAYSSLNYALIIEDSAGIIHYWDFDGAYDGWSHSCDKDVKTKTDMN